MAPSEPILSHDVENAIMHIRLLPQGLDPLTTQELVRMGHQAPETLGQHDAQAFVCKVMDIPRDVASQLTACLQRQPEFLHTPCWWHEAPGEHADTCDLLIGGTRALPRFLRQSAQRAPALNAMAQALEQALQDQHEAPAHLQLGDAQLPLGQRTYVMGIVNVTPDSFSDGGLYLQPEQAVKHAEAMLEDGADIIDVGGASSRPGATPTPPDVEAARVVPVVRGIVERFGALVSVDTYHASVARAALDEGAVMINDISAMRFDPGMAPLLADRQAAVVLMHMQGDPQTMQRAPAYRHVNRRDLRLFGRAPARRDAARHGARADRSRPRFWLWQDAASQCRFTQRLGQLPQSRSAVAHWHVAQILPRPSVAARGLGSPRRHDGQRSLCRYAGARRWSASTTLRRLCKRCACWMRCGACRRSRRVEARDAPCNPHESETSP